MIARAATFSIRLLIRFYQRIVRPMLKFSAGPGAGCRFSPSCSNYFLEAVETRGPLRGSWIGICRILRCHPWGGSGYDPVPPARGVKPSSEEGHSTCRRHH